MRTDVADMDPQLAFLGMGNMGRAMSKNLAVKGGLKKPLILWNRTYHRAADHATLLGHSIAVHTIGEAIAQSDCVWSCFTNEQAVNEVFDVVSQLEITGKLFVECSTIAPEGTNRLAEMVINKGAEFVAMPVFGEPSLANAGKLTCVPGGLPQSVDRIKPFLVGVVGQAVIDLSGEEPGKASLLKNIGNVIILTTMETVAECHVFAEKTGLGVANLQKLMEALFPVGPHMIYSKAMSTGRYYKEKPIVSIEDARNVSSHVLELAESHKVALNAYKVAREHLTIAERHVGPKGDIMGIYGAVRLESDMDYANTS